MELEEAKRPQRHWEVSDMYAAHAVLVCALQRLRAEVEALRAKNERLLKAINQALPHIWGDELQAAEILQDVLKEIDTGRCAVDSLHGGTGGADSASMPKPPVLDVTLGEGTPMDTSVMSANGILKS